MVNVSNLEKSYEGRKALNGISFSIEKGEFYGLLGPNGACEKTRSNLHKLFIFLK